LRVFASHASWFCSGTRRDERDAAGAAHEAGWFAAAVFFDPAALRVWRARVDLRRDQRHRVEIAVVIHRLQHHRIVGSDAVEFLQREAARFVGELFFGPAAENHDPFAGGGAAHPIGEHLERLLPRGHAVESQLVVLGRANPMGMVVDQSRDDGAASEVDDPRLRTFERLDLGRGADLEDALAPDGERLRDGEAVVHGYDLAVDEHRVGGLCPRRRRRREGSKRKPNDAPERWSHVESLSDVSRCWPRSRYGGAQPLVRQPGSMPRFLKAAAAAGAVMNLTSALAPSASLAPAIMPLENMVNCWTSAGSGPT
jgi:hypothetical protein